MQAHRSSINWNMVISSPLEGQGRSMEPEQPLGFLT